MNKRAKRHRLKQAVPGYLFGAVSIAGLFFFYVAPFLGSVLRTVVKTDGGEIHFGGIGPYRDLFLYSLFGQALFNTLKMAVIGIPLLLLLALLLTYFMNRLTVNKVRGVSFWFAVHLLPMILPSVVIGTVVKLIFAKYGLLNGFLVKCGAAPVEWLRSQWAFWILCVIFLWKNTGYSMVVLFGGLSAIEKEQTEAAALDGADDRQIFLRVIMPQLSVFLRFIIIMGIIGIFKIYRESYLILGDSPVDEAYMIQNFLSNNFASLNFDRTVMASVLLFLLIGAVLLLLFRFTGEGHEKKKKRKK